MRSNPPNGKSTDFEVTILGGGPAGCATALALARRGIKNILLVESGRYGTPRVGESIPPDTRLLLDDLGIWQEFLQQAHEPCLGSCSAWGRESLGYNDFLFNPLGHGWHLDRSRFDRFLAEMASRRGVTVSLDTRFVNCEAVADAGYRVELRRQGEDQVTHIDTRFVVDAMGMHSGLARSLGARKRFLDRLICVCGMFEYSASSGVSRLTVLEAAEYGWWYAARLPNQISVVAVASDPETVKAGAFRNLPDWHSRLNETRHISKMVAGHRFPHRRLQTYPALSYLLDNAAGQRWLAVGDASSAYDPISSQGIYKALSNGLSAAEAIATCLGGRTDALDDYQSDVKAQFDDYLQNRNFFYAMETRWPGSLFWRRRQERTEIRQGA